MLSRPLELPTESSKSDTLPLLLSGCVGGVMTNTMDSVTKLVLTSGTD